MFDGCGSCNSDMCEVCADSNWVLTQNGCYESISNSGSEPQKMSNKESEAAKSDINNSSTFGIVVIAIIGSLKNARRFGNV